MSGAGKETGRNYSYTEALRSRAEPTEQTEITEQIHHGGTESRSPDGAWSAAGRWLPMAGV
jgi:hypothetical protein